MSPFEYKYQSKWHYLSSQILQNKELAEYLTYLDINMYRYVVSAPNHCPGLNQWPEFH